jgi:HK97 family phage major capsid protein
VHQGQAFVPFSVQAEDDLDALAADVSEMFADAKARLELNAFTLGTGTGQPFGFVTEAATVATTAADTYAIADVYKLQQGVSPRYRGQGKWMMNLNIINLTRQFGTANNYHGFLTDLGGGKPSQLLGQDLYENSELLGTITAAQTNKIVAYGDFSKYRIHDRIGMTVELIPTLFGATRRPTGQRGWYCRFRHGARLVDTNAVKLLDA